MPADVSFASFNLYNFQKAGLKTYGNTPVTPQEYTAKRDWTRQTLIKLNADVVAFQELWHKDCLDDVLNTPELADYQPIYIGDQWYNIAVALIVRKPWQLDGQAEIIKSFPFSELIKVDEDNGEDDEVEVTINRFSRSVLKATLTHNTSSTTPPITVFCCHFKSKVPTYIRELDSPYESAIQSAISTIRRTAEATALRMMLMDTLSGEGTPTVVLGDLNDEELSNTLNLITNQPTISTRSRGSDTSLYSTLQFQQLQSFRDVYYTHEHNNHKGVLDHILVSEEFFEYSSDVVWKHQQTRILNDHIDDDNPATSDHGIIVSSFT